VVAEPNAAPVGKLAAGTLLRGRKLRVDTTVVEADIDDPPMPICWSRPWASWVGWCGGSRAVVPPAGPGSAIVVGRPAVACRQLARTLRRRTGVAMAEVDRLTGEVAQIARHTLGQVQAVAGNARRVGARRPEDGRLGGWSMSWPRRSVRPSGCWPRPTSGWPAPG
jgi:transposase, IS5 family